MSSGNVTACSRKLSELHPFKTSAAALLRACPERAQRVERETSLAIVNFARAVSGNSKRFLHCGRNDII